MRTVARKIGDWVNQLGAVWVDGEIAQLTRRPGTRTAFLVLRDTAADVSLSVTCAIDALDPTIRDGARVVVLGKPDFFLARGTLSLRAREIRPLGVGALLARVEAVKRVLGAEGLFEAGRKHRLPFLPAGIGLVTGRASAAERDVLRTATTRWPAVRFEIRNVAVQGPGAAGQVIAALRALESDPAVDVIVLARGGGSVEDLLPFSDEALCRAVAACYTPVVSAIGHEPDTPLVDLVADLRCSTPTDAGKRIVPDVVEETDRIGQLRDRGRRAVNGHLHHQSQLLVALRERPVLADPYTLVTGPAKALAGMREQAWRALDHDLRVAAAHLANQRLRIRSLSPAGTLQRGYAILQRHDGSVLSAAADAVPGETLTGRVADGSVPLLVTVGEGGG